VKPAKVAPFDNGMGEQYPTRGVHNEDQDDRVGIRSEIDAEGVPHHRRPAYQVSSNDV
jgi:hypothetical protein